MSLGQKKWVRIAYIIYYLLLAAASLYCFVHDLNGLDMAPVAAFTCFLVPLALKLLHLKPIFEMYILNVVFATIASIAGSMLDAYAIPYFDKVLHFCSGFLITLLGFILFSYFMKKTDFQNQRERLFSIFYCNAFNMQIAVYWEFFEYGCLIFLNNDAIRHYTTGVHDSITDMLMSFFAGICVTLEILHYYRTGKDNCIIRLNRKLYTLNFQDPNQTETEEMTGLKSERKIAQSE